MSRAWVDWPDEVRHRFQVGDRVRLGRQRGTVEEVVHDPGGLASTGRDRLKIQLDNGKRIEIDAEEVRPA